MKLTKEVSIHHPLGLHARPASVITQALQNVSSRVTFVYEERQANARSVLELLMLAVQQGSKMEVTVEGEDAQTVMEKLTHLLEKELGGKFS